MSSFEPAIGTKEETMARKPTSRIGALRLLGVAAFTLAASAFAFAAGTTAPAAPTTSPHGIIINHKFKVKDLGLSCDACHSPSQTMPTLMTFPTMDNCAVCHTDETDMSKGTDKCTMCHTNPDYSATMPIDKILMPEIKFDHRKHADAKVDCLSCHNLFDKVGVTGDEMLPTMSTCIACHKAQNVPNGTDCATCHVNSNISSTKPAYHTAEWIHTHGKGLSQATIQGTCNNCHTVQSGNDCNSCHQREKPPTHNAGWTLGAHGIVARSNPQSCATCHTQQQCLDCHTSQKPWTHTSTWDLGVKGTGSATGDKPGHCVTCHIGATGPSLPGSQCATCHSDPDRNITSPSYNHKMNPGSNCFTCHK